jgi:hypothetical protein
VDNRGANSGLSSRTNASWRGAAPTKGTASAGSGPVFLNVSMEKAIEVKYDQAESGFTVDLPPPSPPSPPSPPRVYGGSGQQPDGYNHHVQRYSFPPPRDASKSIGTGRDGSVHPSAGVHPPRRANTAGQEVIQYPGYASSAHWNGVYQPAPGLEPPPTSHPFSSAIPVNMDTQAGRPSSIMIIGNPTHPPSAPGGDSGGNGSGRYWPGPNQ